ncbi:MAG: AraC family transcriptional regulator N-terminal domain-containing protein [Arachidicoccus sp.]|nr:AraC family transcriptional regulator N-terminal domain-containing protein [Arachidicoccus sp.]
MSNLLTTNVDRKQSFAMDSFELSVLETFEKATVRQVFPEPIFYNLLRGKKIMTFGNENSFDFLPGKTMIVPAKMQMEVFFPESSHQNPTECLSLTIDRFKIAESLALLNERYPRLDGRLWQLSMKNYSLINSVEISKLIFKLYKLAPQNSQEARIIAELTLTEILILLFQNQNLTEDEALNASVSGSTLQHLLVFIHDNLDCNLTISMLAKQTSMSNTSLFRIFKKEFNVSPVEYINKARINKAKQLLKNCPDMNISAISYAVGFNNPNYFTRTFKQHNLISPMDFRKQL